MLFHYKAINPKGKIIEADIESATAGDALASIAANNLKPISLKPAKKFSFNIKRFFGQKITLEDKVFITKYLSLMLRVGTDLFRAINILIDDFDKEVVKKLLTEIRSNLEKGMPFYTTFAKYPKSFSPVFVNLIRSGEVSGNLERVFSELSLSLEKERELTSKIKSSLTYPIILFVSSIVILILLVSFSLPKIANVFLSGGLKPPPFSQAIFSVGLFIGDHLTLLLSTLIIVVVGGVFFFAKTVVGKRVMYDFALRLPVIKKVIWQTSLQRMAATLSSLLSSGLPIIESIDVTAKSTGVPELKDALVHIAHEGIAKGLTVGDAFKQEPAIPTIVGNLIAISEKSGHLEEILSTLADFYASEVETAVKSMVSFIEPVMLLMIGVVIGTIALAVIIPVYQLTNTF
jgi:type II secretory pathway component PulF